MQGDLLYAICDSGSITTDSCYSEASKFVSLNGKLNLRNVHKFCEMYLLEAGGELNVSGFHGRLQAKMNGGRLRFQLTEVYGDSCIIAMGKPEDLVINISEFVMEHTAMEMTAKNITLDDSLSEMEGCVLENKIFHSVNDKLEINEDKLTVTTDGELKLAKMSWTDTIKLRFGQQLENS